MKKVLLIAVMLFAISTMKAMAQCSGLIHPVKIIQEFQYCQKFDADIYAFGSTRLTYGITATVEVDSARNYTVLGNYQMESQWVAHHDTVQLNGANYNDGQILALQSLKTANDSTYIIPTAGNINGAATYLWTQASTGTYKHVSIIYYGGNYYIR